MEMNWKNKNRNALIKINHYAVGVGLMLKGLDKAEHFDHFPISVIFFFTAGLIIILGATFHHQIAKVFKKFDAVIFLLEGIALLLAGLILLEKEGSKIPYFLLFASSLYFILGTALILTNEANREQVFKKIQIVIKVIFLLGSIIIIIINALFFNSIWMYVIAIIYLVVGSSIDIAARMMKRSSSHNIDHN